MKLLFCLASMLWAASAFKILVMTPLPSKSHFHLGKGIVRSLLKNNHEVTWVTPFPDKDSHKGLSIVDVSSILKEVGSLDQTPNSWSEIKMLTRNISLANLNHPAVREVIVNEQYDAVVSEWFMTDMEAGYAAIQQAPWILLSSIVMHPHLEALVDTVQSTSTIPMVLTNFKIPMSFMERFLNTMLSWFFRLDNWKESYTTEALYESNFTPLAQSRGVPLPPFSAALRNISILLVNSHSSFAAAQRLPPNVVEVGGFHIDEDVPPLPKDLQGILDSSPQGAILFSLGSIVNSSALSKTLKQDLINLFSKLPYTVLWKLEEEIPNLPKNVYTRKWMPQNSILAHPNLKIFMSHSGLLSNLEALYFGIPMLAIPVFADQPRNAEDSVKASRAIKVDFSPDMVPQIEKALKQMSENDKYFKTAKHLSKLFRARPVSPSKLVSFYIELAIETGGAVHLRSKALLYKWYEVQNIDVMVVVLLIFLILYHVCKKLFSIARRCLTKSINNDKSVDKNKKKK